MFPPAVAVAPLRMAESHNDRQLPLRSVSRSVSAWPLDGTYPYVRLALAFFALTTGPVRLTILEGMTSSSRARIVAFVFTALAAGCAAAIAAAAAAAPPTLKASPKVVAFGKNLVLSGTAGRANARVHLLSQPCGFTAPAETQQTTTKAKGAFRFTFQPAITTVFRVTWANDTSRRVRVVVRPLVQIRRLKAGLYAVDVSAGAGSFFKGKKILVQRKVGKKWVTAGKAVLKQNSSETAITAVSSASVRARAPRQAQVRAFLSAAAAAPCYGASASSVVRS
jgi:hypothetical protein